MVCLYLSSEVGLSGLHTICIGLGLKLKEMGLKLGYMKPLGQRYHEEGGRVTDEDAAFMVKTLGLEEDLDDICPVVLSAQLVRESISEGRRDLLGRIGEAFERVSAGKDLVLVQGPFTSNQGWMLGISAYQVAPALDARVVLVECFDDAYLADNILAARQRFGDRLLGVLYNIIPEGRRSFVEEFIAPMLEREGVPVLGELPFDHHLRSISAGELSHLIEGRVLCGEEFLDNNVEDIVVGAMNPEHALRIFRKKRNICVVTGGDRSDIQLAAMEANARCIILTGNLHPSPIILGKAEELGIPLILVSTDTFTTAEKAEFIIRSARTHEAGKLQLVREMFDRYVDLPRLLELAGLPG